MREIRIIVEEEAGRFKVTLKDSAGPGGDTSGTITAETFAQGFADVLVDGEALTPARIREAYAAENDQLAHPREAGEVLHRLLTPGPVGEKWTALRAAHGSVATLLELRPETWAELPWELLYDRQRQLFLFHQSDHTLGHAIPGAQAARFDHSWPLRMLVVVACHPTEDAGIAWEEELRAVEQTACAFSLRLDLHVLKYPKCSRDMIVDTLRDLRPHIFHFIGHGSAEDGGALLLAQPRAESWDNEKWTLPALNADLSTLRQDTTAIVPRIVVLNACQSAGLEGKLMSSSTAAAFRQCGCAAIVAMRGDVRGRAASAFARQFYQQLSESGLDRPDRAYCSALNAITRVADYGESSRVWSLPRIFYAGGISDVFPVDDRLRPCGGFARAVGGHKDLADLKAMVDHHEQRRQLYYSRDKPSWFRDQSVDPVVMVVAGGSRAGKTWFLKSCAYTAFLEGYDTFYCDLRDEEPDPALAGQQDFADFLRAVLRPLGPPKRFFERALIDPARRGDVFDGFVADAEAFLHSPSPGAGAAVTGTEDSRTPLVEKLAQALQRATSGDGATRLFLAFDHVDQMVRSDWYDYVMRGLIQPAADEALGRNLRIAVAIDRDELRNYGFGDGNDYLMPKPIERLPVEDFPELFRLYCCHRLEDKNPEDFEADLALLENLAAGVVARLWKKPWPLSKLRRMYEELVGEGQD